MAHASCMQMKIINLLFMCLAVGVSSVQAAEGASIEDCPQIGWDFKIVPYLRVAQDLQDRGKDVAVEKLRGWASTGEYEDQVFVLCRMLFVSRDKKKFRRPGIGGTHFFGGTDYKDWPLEPIAIHKDVPILITYEYFLFGRAELSLSYVDYCAKECDWSKNQFKVLDRKVIAATVDDWLARRKWPEELSKRDRAFFTKQVEQGGAPSPIPAE